MSWVALAGVVKLIVVVGVLAWLLFRAARLYQEGARMSPQETLGALLLLSVTATLAAAIFLA